MFAFKLPKFLSNVHMKTSGFKWRQVRDLRMYYRNIYFPPESRLIIFTGPMFLELGFTIYFGFSQRDAFGKSLPRFTGLCLLPSRRVHRLPIATLTAQSNGPLVTSSSDIQPGIRFGRFRRRMYSGQSMSKRSRFITLFHTATKSCTNFSRESALP